MSILWISIIAVVLIGLSFVRLPFIAWLFIWPIAVIAFLRLGMTTYVPFSVVQLYFWITVLAVLVYAVADGERFATVTSQLTAFIVEKKYSPVLWLVVVALPLLAAYQIYREMNVEVRAATFGRTVHPAALTEITFKGKKIDLIKGKNPYRELKDSKPDEFSTHVANGKRVYVQNCVYCHGDDLRGRGMYAYGFNPVPAILNSQTTIAMLQESYLFWRIAKGGPGLPEESGPWSSSMPAWENFLTEEEIWDVVLFLYEHTGLNPREAEEHH